MDAGLGFFRVPSLAACSSGLRRNSRSSRGRGRDRHVCLPQQRTVSLVPLRQRRRGDCTGLPVRGSGTLPEFASSVRRPHADEPRQHQFRVRSPNIAGILEIARQIDVSYKSMGLRTRANVSDLCRQALLGHAGHGDDSALAGLLGFEHRLEHDLHNVQYCAYLFRNALVELEQAKGSLRENKTMRDAIEQVDNLIHSRELADFLEGAVAGRTRMAQDGSLNLRRLLDIAFRDCTMPRSVEDAYRVLNVTSSTPLNNVKAIVKALQHMWHPDLVRDEIDRRRFTLKIQQINGAWDLIERRPAAN